MARRYGYTVTIQAWVPVDPTKDDESSAAMAARAAAVKPLLEAGFDVRKSAGVFGHSEDQTSKA